MKKKVFALLLMVCMFFCMNIYAANVSDWAKSELDEAESCGLIPELFENEDFTQSVTRAEFASIAVKLYEKMTGVHIEKTDENPFVDIEQTEYKNEIIKAYRLGITLGTHDDVFEPQQNISREQMATMLCRTIKAAKFDTWSIYCDSAYVMDVDDAVKFNDDADISEYAVNSVYFMAENGIIKGVDKAHFAPLATATREMAILMALRSFNCLKDIELSADLPYYYNTNVVDYGAYFQEEPYHNYPYSYYYHESNFDANVRNAYFKALKKDGYRILREFDHEGAKFYELTDDSCNIRFIEDYLLDHLEIHIRGGVEPFVYYDGFEFVVAFDSFCESEPIKQQIPGTDLLEICYSSKDLSVEIVEEYKKALKAQGYRICKETDNGEMSEYKFNNTMFNSYNDVTLQYYYEQNKVIIIINTKLNRVPLG